MKFIVIYVNESGAVKVQRFATAEKLHGFCSRTTATVVKALRVDTAGRYAEEIRTH